MANPTRERLLREIKDLYTRIPNLDPGVIDAYIQGPLSQMNEAGLTMIKRQLISGSQAPSQSQQANLFDFLGGIGSGIGNIGRDIATPKGREWRETPPNSTAMPNIGGMVGGLFGGGNAQAQPPSDADIINRVASGIPNSIGAGTQGGTQPVGGIPKYTIPPSWRILMDPDDADWSETVMNAPEMEATIDQRWIAQGLINDARKLAMKQLEDRMGMGGGGVDNSLGWAQLAQSQRQFDIQHAFDVQKQQDTLQNNAANLAMLDLNRKSQALADIMRTRQQMSGYIMPDDWTSVPFGPLAGGPVPTVRFPTGQLEAAASGQGPMSPVVNDFLSYIARR